MLFYMMRKLFELGQSYLLCFFVLVSLFSCRSEPQFFQVSFFPQKRVVVARPMDIPQDPFADKRPPYHPSGSGDVKEYVIKFEYADKEWTLGDYTGPVATADLNLDGTTGMITGDIIPGVTSGLYMAMLDQQGKKMYNYPFILDNGPVAFGVAAVDINHDRYPDILAATNISGKELQVLLRDPSKNPSIEGAYTDRRSFPNGSSSTSAGMIVSDLNQDRHIDVAIAHYESGQLGVILGDGRGNFGAAKMFAAGENPTELYSADLNHDSFPDVVTLDPQGKQVLVFINRGDGSFFPAAPIRVASTPQVAALADLNRDGNIDLVVTSIFSRSFFVFLGKGTGEFQVPDETSVSFAPGAISIDDIDGDGTRDLVLGRFCSVFEEPSSHGFCTYKQGEREIPDPTPSLFIFRGDGRGKFTDMLSIVLSFQDILSRTNILRILTPDINHDGKPDMVVFSNGTLLNGTWYSSSAFTVFINRSFGIE